MSANKLIERMGIEPELAERFRKQLRDDKSDFGTVMSSAVHAYLSFRSIGDLEYHKNGGKNPPMSEWAAF